VIGHVRRGADDDSADAGGASAFSPSFQRKLESICFSVVRAQVQDQFGFQLSLE